MLRRLVINNFQIWERLVVDLDKEITTFVGPSDTGKSAILRAFALVCFNTPSGLSYIKHDSEGTRLVLYVDKPDSQEDDFWKITRNRTPTNNSYELEDEEYKSFGTGVPNNIAAVLNLNEEINFQWQIDGPFWFTLTPGQVSRNLNAIVALDEIDDALSSVGTKLTQARANLKLVKERKEKADKTVESLEWVPGVVEDLEVIAKQEKERAEIQLQAAALKSIIQRRKDTAASIVEDKSFDRLFQDLEEAIKESQYNNNQRSELQHLHTRRKDYRRSLGIFGDTTPNISELTELRRQYEDIFYTRSQLERPVTRARKILGELCDLRNTITEIEERLQTISGGVCPMCGSIMEKKHTHS